MTEGPGRRVRGRITGTVQGVGFRPYAYRLATSLGLSGFVRNGAHGVLVEVEGPPAAIEAFFQRLAATPPPLARIEAVALEELTWTGGQGFGIATSDGAASGSAQIAPDTATCDACVAEMFDPANRRYRYPFINCTDCGPRYTIVHAVPYDRALTTMAGFTMCGACHAEYHDPANRRFHAQPNACAACGPSVRLHGADGSPVPPHGDAVVAAGESLRAGGIVAIKGIGGFHLACRADDEQVVATLRARKQRENRPFALMAADVAMAAELIELDQVGIAILCSGARPILLAPRRPRAPIASSVAPRVTDLGVMLPYTPIHHLLLRAVAFPLVMTSGNSADEPIAHRDDDAHARLAGIADLFLTHDRPIAAPAEDSVLQVSHAAAARPMTVRRSRGFVPSGLALPVPSPADLLACGAQSKSTVCLARAGTAWLSPHLGDLGGYEARRGYRDAVAHLQRLCQVEPRAIAHDLHPDYASTAFAQEFGVELVSVQHHHAHLAACLAEHNETGPAVGVVYDGSGYGTDGSIWGGEILVGDLIGFERVGHLRPVRLPGGEAAVREPWRMACAWVQDAFGDEPPMPPGLSTSVSATRWHAVARLARSGSAAPMTSSVGRLFDAVAALCGICAEVTYEGQAAVELAALADWSDRQAYPLRLAEGADGGSGIVLDARDTIMALTRDLATGVPRPSVSARFHNALASATAAASVRVANERGLRTIVLTGGVFQNRMLMERVAELVSRSGRRLLVPEQVPANDGGIAFGQAAIAAARLQARRPARC